MTSLSSPESRASSIPYCRIGLSTSGSISFGMTFVAGKNRVPKPAQGKTQVRSSRLIGRRVSEGGARRAEGGRRSAEGGARRAEARKAERRGRSAEGRSAMCFRSAICHLPSAIRHLCSALRPPPSALRAPRSALRAPSWPPVCFGLYGKKIHERAGMRKLLILLAVLLSTTSLSAQWRRAGLFGADVRALIADPSNPDLLFLGTSGGEVYVSRDGARSWSSPRNGIPFPSYVVDNLLLDREGRLWAASWGLWGGGVIAVSPDGGKSWERRDKGLEDLSVRAIAIDANDANFLVAGGLTGVFRSTDGGASWTKISDQENVESLAIDPKNRDRIYIGTWRQGWRTDDGAKTWKNIRTEEKQ